MEFNYLVYQVNAAKTNERVIAGFMRKIDALEYADTMQSINRAAGYHDTFRVLTLED